MATYAAALDDALAEILGTHNLIIKIFRVTAVGRGRVKRALFLFNMESS